MTVDANLIVAERADALLVPTTSVKDGAVWVVRNGRLSRQPVKIGVAGDARSEVLEGLAADAQVVAQPGDALVEGRRARIRRPGEKAGAAANAAAPANAPAPDAAGRR
jgi:hypothetical protein